MADENNFSTTDLTGLTADLVSAYVTNPSNHVSADELPGLILNVYNAFSNLGSATVEASGEPAVEHKTKAEIKKSIGPDYLISFEDGRQFKSMKRHLSILGLTPDQYRAKWGLPATYPMVAPNYAAQRSAMAKSMGLGSGGRQPKKPARKPKA